MRKKLGLLVSHPIQYYAPLFRQLARDVDLTVYFAYRQTPKNQAEAGFGVAFDWDVDILGGFSHEFLENIAKSPRVNNFFGCDTPSIFGIVQSGRFDAFLVMGWYLKCYWQAIRACRRLGVPVLVRGDSQMATPRGRIKRWGKEIVYPRLLSQFDAVLYVGQRNRDYLKHYGVSDERLFFSPHCVDSAWFAMRSTAVNRGVARTRVGAATNEKLVLFVGKLLDGKRPLDIVLALKILKDGGMSVRGVFAGDGPLRRALELEGDSLGVPLTMLGFCNQTELPDIYMAADVVVLPSSSETWGLVINEALACSTPVVVSDSVGCAPDLVASGHTGETYTVGDVVALSAALGRVLNVPPPTSAMLARSEQYSVSAASKGILLALDSVCGNREK